MAISTFLFESGIVGIGSVAADVATVPKTETATIERDFSINFNRTLHPYRRWGSLSFQKASSTALIVTSKTHNNYPTHNRDFT